MILIKVIINLGDNMNYFVDFINTLNGITNLSYIFPAIGTGMTVSAPIAVMKLSNVFKERKDHKDTYLKVAKKANSSKVMEREYLKLRLKDKKEVEEIRAKLEIPEQLQEISNEFFEKVNIEDQPRCINNLKTLKFNHIRVRDDIALHLKNMVSSLTAAAWYSSGSNKIEDLEHKPSKRVLSHEFLHMASSNLYESGFNQIGAYDSKDGKKIYVGRGLNEGYTELLNCRLFGYDLKKCTYMIPVKLTRLIETFFDNPRDMEKAYFNNDIAKVYLEFCKYGSNEEFWNLMNEMDSYAYAPLSFDFINSIGTQMRLYKVIKRSDNPEKIKKFEDILDENKFIALARRGMTFKLDDGIKKEKHI